MRNKRQIPMAAIFLGSLHLAILFAGFVAPYNPTAQNRDFPFAPPTRIHFVDDGGKFHLRPFIYALNSKPRPLDEYDESHERRYPLRFFVNGDSYKLAGVVSLRIHLIGVDEGGILFLVGTDDYGRDLFSRVLYGGQISLAAGLLATAISLALGFAVGCLSGFYAGWFDESVMRVAELFLVLPWLYFLLAVRSFLPMHIAPIQAFLVLVAVIGTIGWSRPARLVRGVVLSVKSRKYVAVSRGFGASDLHILRHHILPSTYSILLTQAALLVPQYVLAEVTLSFFGLGVGEPAPSWGNLLANLQKYEVMASYWWMFAPAVALILVSFGYLRLADTFHEHLQSGTI